MSIRTALGITTLLSLVWATSGRPDVQLLDPGATEVLRPATVVRASDQSLPAVSADRYGLHYPDDSFSVSGTTAAERNASYSLHAPFPSVTFERTDKSGPLSGYRAGVEQVFAYRYECVSDSPERTKRILWRWEPPEDIKVRYPARAGRGGKERYKFLCLYPTGYRNTWEQDPVMLCFDSTSGLKWRTAPPVVSDPGIELPEVRDGYRAHFNSSPGVRGHVGCAPDGERTVVLLYPYPSRDTTWMYVLDGDGRIVRALVIPEREGVANAQRYGQVLRAGGKGAFIVAFRHTVPINANDPDGGQRTVHESYLIDRDGNFLRKFVDEEGRPVRISMSGERHALAGRPGEDGGWEHLIYKLP